MLPFDVVPFEAQLLFVGIAYLFVGSLPCVERFTAALRERASNAISDFVNAGTYL